MKSWTVGNTNRLKKIVDRLSPEDGKFICRVIYRDPLTDIYMKLLIIYAFMLGGFLLWPFDFASLIINDARWIGKSTGIEFLRIGKTVSESSPQEFYDRLVKGNGLTLEMWLKTEDLNQAGPARILSYSIDSGLRNFTIGQSRDQLVVRLRTTETNNNGTNPHLILDDVFNYRSLQHIVIMYDFSEQRVYINGEQKARSDVLNGNFSNWDPSCKLVIGNEVTGYRPWKGKIYYAAVYDRPLTKLEIHQNYLSEFRLKKNKKNTKDTAIKAKGPVARYLFDEGKGDVIHDSGSGLSPVNLFFPEIMRIREGPFLGFSIDSLLRKSLFSDIVINIMIFVPLGVLIHGMLRTRFGLTLIISLAALLIGTLLTLCIESIQYFSMTRSSSLIDVSMNVTGTTMGIMIDRAYILFLNHQSKRFQMILYDQTE